MAVEMDGLTFRVSGRPRWWVGGELEYTRVDPLLWRARLRAMADAGCNLVRTSAVWRAHETEDGVFDFSEGRDLGRFIRLAAEEGVAVWLRVGPYVGGGFACGGLPDWLHTVKTTKKQGPMRIRQSNTHFVASASRWYQALLGQVASLQAGQDRPARAAAAVPGGRGGGIVAMEIESDWLGTSPTQAADFHGEMLRYLHELGARVPVTAANQFAQMIDGTLQVWQSARGEVSATRQVASLQPGLPRMTILDTADGGRLLVKKPQKASDAGLEKLTRELALMTAGGGLWTVRGFDGTPGAGALDGRVLAEDCDPDGRGYGEGCLVEADGTRLRAYDAVKRLGLFIRSFEEVFTAVAAAAKAGVKAGARSGSLAETVIDPEAGTDQLSIIPLQGARGSVDFVFAPEGGSGTREVAMLTGEGLRFNVPVAAGGAAWCVRNVDLAEGVRLDYATLSAWVVLRDVDERGEAYRPSNLSGMAEADEPDAPARDLGEGEVELGTQSVCLVVFGPAGAQGAVSINGAVWEGTVGSGKDPEVIELGGVSLVVLSTRQVDASVVERSAVGVPFRMLVGCDGVEDDGWRARAGWPKCSSVEVSAGEGGAGRAASWHVGSHDGSGRSKPRTLKLSGFRSCDAAGALPAEEPGKTTRTGKAAKAKAARGWQPIAHPLALEALAPRTGYAWLMHRSKSSAASDGLLNPGLTGRVLVLPAEGSVKAIELGEDCAAQAEPLALDFKPEVAVLMDGGSRWAEGQRVGEAAGLAGGGLVGGGRYAPQQGLSGGMGTGDFWSVSDLPLTGPETGSEKVPDAFLLGGWVDYAVEEGRGIGQTLSWRVKLTKKPVVICASGLEASGTLVVNGRPVGRFGPQTGGRVRVLMDPEEIVDDVRDEHNFVQPGMNDIVLAFDRHTLDAAVLKAAGKALKVYRLDKARTGADASGEWFTQPWSPPAALLGRAPEPAEGEDAPVLPAVVKGRPSWSVTELALSQDAIDGIGSSGCWVETRGLTRGRVLVNDVDCGAYATDAAPTRGWPARADRVWVPPSVIGDGPVQVCIFDEAGASPDDVRLIV